MCYSSVYRDRSPLLPTGLPARGLVLWTGCPNCRKLVTELGQPLYRKLDQMNLVYYTDGPPAAQAGFPAYAHDRQHLRLSSGLRVPALFNNATQPVYGPTVSEVRQLL
jgi:hypothetical protein